MGILRAFGTVMAAMAALQTPALRPQTATDIHVFPIPAGLASLADARPEPLATAPGYENQPMFEPGGRQVLYTANRDGKQTDIFEFDRQTRATRQLTRTPEGEYSPTIPAARPSGRALARDGFTVIRVEADGTQRLWQFDRDGANPLLVLPDIKPVGYHVWADADRLVLYVLGEPATLHVARVSTGTARVVARDVGRTLRVIPGTARVSFVQRESGNDWAVMALDPETGQAERLVSTVAGSLDRDYEWMPDGQTVLMTAGTKVFAWSRGVEGWRPVLDVAAHGLGDATRLAVSPDGTALAVVTAERPRQAPERFFGTWRLISYQILDAAGGPPRPGAYDTGRITYDRSGQMTAQLMNSANTSDRAPATEEERAAAFRRYLGYFGGFTVDEARGVVTHHVAGSSNPSWVGSNQVRYFAFSADGRQLTLSLRSGDRVTQTLLWERMQ